ncbi:MAG: hypothetical protein AB8F94_08880 [Saprospiraceae bacterium]
MIYQVIEREIYAGDVLLHFGEKLDYGDIINQSIPDYSGLPLGTAIFTSDQKEEVIESKRTLEIKRMKCMNELLPTFFSSDEWAEKFYTSENFNRLVSFYKNEFGLDLIRKHYYEMTIEPVGFHIPVSASEEQILTIQSLLGLSFFKIIEKE